MMAAELKPYPAYKDSGVPWLGEVPAHWEVQRVARRLTVVKRPVNPNEISDQQVVHYSIPNVQQIGRGVLESGLSIDSAKNLVDRTLLLVSKLNPRKGTIALAEPDQELITLASSEFVAMEPKHCVGRFAQYLYESEHVRLELSSRVDSATKSHQRCSPEDISKLQVPWPPLPEQTAIVRFLNHADRRIWRYIRAKRKLITLLEEQKQTIIHQAVTGQIDIRTGQPYPAYKPSGVEWLGDVPTHWEVIRFGRLVTLTVGFPFKSEGFTQSEHDMRLLRGVNVAPGRLRWEDLVRWSATGVDAFSEYQLEVGDIVLGMDRPIIGNGTRVAIVNQSDVPSLLLQRVARIRPDGGKLLRDFAFRLLGGSGFADYLAPIFTGVSVPHLSPDQIREFRIAVPSLAEQEEIERHLGSIVGDIQSAADCAQSQINLLHEYRTRLIADVVTGKLDVREAAAVLPEVDPLAAEDTLEDTLNVEAV